MQHLKKILFLTITFVLILSLVPVDNKIFATTDVPSTDKTFTETTGSYSIQTMVEKLGLFIFEDLIALHSVGSIIVGGNAKHAYGEGNHLSYGNYTDGVSSYVRGSLSRANTEQVYLGNVTPVQYLGTVNKNNLSYVNGVWRLYGDTFTKANVYLTDTYVDFAEAYQSIQSESEALFGMAERTITEADILLKDDWFRYIEIAAGEQVLIGADLMNSLSYIYISGNIKDKTIINCDSSGHVVMPEIRLEYNYKVDQHPEIGTGVNLILNMPYATKVEYKNSLSVIPVGHLIAVNADVEHKAGNHDGIIVAASLESTSEFHRFKYDGPTILPEEIPDPEPGETPDPKPEETPDPKPEETPDPKPEETPDPEPEEMRC